MSGTMRGRASARAGRGTPSPGTMSRVVVELLVTTERTLAVAEACTAGLLAHELTTAPGAEAVFVGGLVTFGSKVTSPMLALPEGSADHPDAARQLATRTRRLLGADVAVATAGALHVDDEGVATSGSVLIGVDLGDDVRTACFELRGTAEGMRRLAVTATLQVLLAGLTGRGGGSTVR